MPPPSLARVPDVLISLNHELAFSKLEYGVLHDMDVCTTKF